MKYSLSVLLKRGVDQSDLDSETAKLEYKTHHFGLLKAVFSSKMSTWGESTPCFEVFLHAFEHQNLHQKITIGVIKIFQKLPMICPKLSSLAALFRP